MTAVLNIDPAAVEPIVLITALGHPAYRYSEGVLTLTGVSQADADAALANYQPPQPTAEEIEAERWRRVIAWLGAANQVDAEGRLQDGNRRAMELMSDRLIDGRTWTQAEADEAALLRAMAAKATAFRTAADTLKAAPVVDYTADVHWPDGGQ